MHVHLLSKQEVFTASECNNIEPLTAGPFAKKQSINKVLHAFNNLSNLWHLWNGYYSGSTFQRTTRLVKVIFLKSSRLEHNFETSQISKSLR